MSNLFLPSQLKRLAGESTRGKTAQNRLRRLDTFLIRYDRGLLLRAGNDYAQALFVDLGYGATPVTTLESARQLWRINPQLGIVGVEIDPERVTAALPFARDRLDFRLGGFNLPLKLGKDGSRETVRAIRAMNVLRQYDEANVTDAYARLAEFVLPGGLLLEGTCDPLGRLMVVNFLRRRAADAAQLWDAEGLLFSTNFRSDNFRSDKEIGKEASPNGHFDPSDFQAVLPKNFIHRMVVGEPIYEFMQAWKRAARATASMQAWGAKQWFMAAAEQLAAEGAAVNTQRKWLSRRYLIWKLQGCTTQT